MGRRDHYHVYVIELSRDVLLEGRFRRANPGYIYGRPCVYVGMTGLDPDVRFDKHKAGLQANRYVQRFGLRLLPALYEVYNPMPYDAARDMEVELAIDLRESMVFGRPNRYAYAVNTMCAALPVCNTDFSLRMCPSAWQYLYSSHIRSKEYFCCLLAECARICHQERCSA